MHPSPCYLQRWAILTLACVPTALIAQPPIPPIIPPPILVKPTPEELDKQIAAAIQQLGDRTYRVREAAKRSLIAIGPPADRLLKEASMSPDPEIAERAKAILERIAEINFDKVIKRIRRASQSGDWRKPGWKDEIIESWLRHLVNQVGVVAKNRKLQLPVRIGTVEPIKVADKFDQVVDGLFIGRDVEIREASRSVLLIDGNVNIRSADDCVIIARGAVEISSSSGNFVVAGHYLSVRHDGPVSWDRVEKTLRPSVLLSGSVLALWTGGGTICCCSGTMPTRFLSQEKHLEPVSKLVLTDDRRYG